MKLPSLEWFRRVCAEEDCDPPACVGCGAMAGVCTDYPNCPGGRMTTQVKVTHNGGNHAVMVNVLSGDKRGPDPVAVVSQTRLEKEGDETTAYVHGSQSVEIVEADG